MTRHLSYKTEILPQLTRRLFLDSNLAGRTKTGPKVVSLAQPQHYRNDNAKRQADTRGTSLSCPLLLYRVAKLALNCQACPTNSAEPIPQPFRGSSPKTSQSPPKEDYAWSDKTVVGSSSLLTRDDKSHPPTSTSPNQSSDQASPQGSSASQSSDYGIRKWLGQTPQEEPWTPLSRGNVLPSGDGKEKAEKTTKTNEGENKSEETSG